jgi:hypothetical protein
MFTLCIFGIALVVFSVVTPDLNISPKSKALINIYLPDFVPLPLPFELRLFVPDPPLLKLPVFGTL